MKLPRSPPTPIEQYCLGNKQPLIDILGEERFETFEKKFLSWGQEDFNIVTYLSDCERYLRTL